MNSVRHVRRYLETRPYDPPCTVTEIASALGMAERHVREAVRALLADGMSVNVYDGAFVLWQAFDDSPPVIAAEKQQIAKKSRDLSRISQLASEAGFDDSLDFVAHMMRLHVTQAATAAVLDCSQSTINQWVKKLKLDGVYVAKKSPGRPKGTGGGTKQKFHRKPQAVEAMRQKLNKVRDEVRAAIRPYASFEVAE